MEAVPGLSVPPTAITDGSADPQWVELPCRGGYAYGRRRLLRLPFDAGTATVARRWLRFERLHRTVLIPVTVVLLSAALVLLFTDAGTVSFALYGTAVLIQLAAGYAEKKLTVAQHPEVIGRLGVYFPAVSAVAAREWVRHGVAMEVVRRRPRWRRYPPLVHRWAAGSAAVAAAAVWWFALRDGEFGLVMLFAFVALLGAAVVSAVKALPVGFVRFDDAPDL
jgi:hypothetical protein